MPHGLTSVRAHAWHLTSRAKLDCFWTSCPQGLAGPRAHARSHVEDKANSSAAWAWSTQHDVSQGALAHSNTCRQTRSLSQCACHAGGGAISCQHVDTQNGLCNIESRGGSVQIAGLDGNTHIQSEGGDVSITACDNIQTLRVGSSGGAIDCSVAPGALMSGAVIHVRGSTVSWPADDVDPAQRETHMRMAAAKSMQQAMQQQGGEAAADGQQDVGNTASRAARAGDADAAAAAAHQHSLGPSCLQEGLGDVGGAGEDMGEGWDTRLYMNGQQTVADKVDPARCSRILLDAGQGSVSVSIVSWVASMKAKMAAGR